MKTLKNILLYIWQLPQNIIGLLIICYIKLVYSSVIIKNPIRKYTFTNDLFYINYYYFQKFNGGISLGKYIIINTHNSNTIKHEYGHSIQSMYLGPLYLFIIGIPSIIWAGLYGTKLFPVTLNGYYKFYTEKWADKLVNIKR